MPISSTASPPTATWRPLEAKDNTAVATLIRTVLAEFGLGGPGYASNDPEMEDMYAAYQSPDSRYWVLVDSATERIVGCGGFSRLKGTAPEDGICELQKLYFYPEARGQGQGLALVTRAIEEARQVGYRQMYLETAAPLERATHLYQRLGFKFLDAPMGNTGHAEKCGFWMLRPL